MFDIGFMEMALIGVVALVVIGPERLPGVARTVGQWMGSARRFMSSVQADINREVGKADELKRLLEEQTNIQSMHEILEQTPVDADERKPVPRATPAGNKSVENKPDYLVKAIPDAPVADDSSSASSEKPSSDALDSSSDSSSSSSANSSASSKHD